MRWVCMLAAAGLFLNFSASAENIVALPPAPQASVDAFVVGNYGLGNNSIGLYKCKNNSGNVIVCYFVLKRIENGETDYQLDNSKIGWNLVRLIDNFQVEHTQLRAYFINGLGQEQSRLNLGHDESAWLAYEFNAGPQGARIAQARVVFTRMGGGGFDRSGPVEQSGGAASRP